MNREQFIAEVERRGYEIHYLGVVGGGTSGRRRADDVWLKRKGRIVCVTAESFEAILEELPEPKRIVMEKFAEAFAITFTNAQKSAKEVAEHQWNNFIAGSPCKAGALVCIDENGLVRPANLAAVAIDESVLPECNCPAIELAAAGHLPGCPYPAAKAEAERDAEAGVDD